MSWDSWTSQPLVPSLVLFVAVVVLWTADSGVVSFNLLTVCIFLVLSISVAPDKVTRVFNATASVAATLIEDWRLDRLTWFQAKMIIVLSAVIWLLNRSWQTLWKPVPELIDILGVEVPAKPDVSLAAIGADKASITWTRPPANRPVEKYVIQVNGVNVGESGTSHENYITVSGLKPNHFYNVRIIAVGSNNFQAVSRVLRLRTFASSGEPCLGNARLPTDFSSDDPPLRTLDAAGSDANGSAKTGVTSTFVVTQPLPQEPSPYLAKDGSSGGLSHSHSSRRNTVNRRHSPSTASLEQQHLSLPGSSNPDSGNEVTEEKMAALNQKYLNLRKETEDTVALIQKEEEDTKALLDEYEAEKKRKKQELKRKEEQTEKLKREQGATERLMRSALQRQKQREKKLKEKTAEIERTQDNIDKWTKEIQEMAAKKANYEKKYAVTEEEHKKKLAALREKNAATALECASLEAELKEKRQKVKSMEDERKSLASNSDAAGVCASINTIRREWQRTELDFRNRLLHETRRQQGLDGHISILSAQIQQIPMMASYANAHSAHSTHSAGHATMSGPVTAPPGFDYDGVPPAQLNRQSRASNSLPTNASSPAPLFSLADMNGPTVTSSPYISIPRPATQHAFLTGPFMGSAADYSSADEAGLRALTAGAPLSPSATSLLPSNIFADDEPSSPIQLSHFSALSARPSELLKSLDGTTLVNGVAGGNAGNGTQTNGNNSSYTRARANGKVNGSSNGSSSGNDPQSPASSNRSMSVLPSPHASSHSLAYPVHTMDSVDGRPSPLGGMPSPTAPQAHRQTPSNGHRFAFFNISRSRGANKALDESGPLIGSLKPGQSQSFPRQGDDVETAIRSRRISLSFSVFGRSSADAEIPDDHFSTGPGMAKPAGFSARNLMHFSSRPNSHIFPDQDANGPRPASVASMDMPRPSTDSGSIWGPPGGEGSLTALGMASRLWPAENAWASRSASRRPSLHGSPSVLKTTLASAEDEILDEKELLNPETSPSYVGVIGRGPPTSAKKASNLGKALNPAAPTFMGNIFRPKSDKDKVKDKDKAKDKTKARDKDKDRGETPAPETPVGPSSGLPSVVVEDSPSNSRLSRDGAHSLHTQASVSESRESLDYAMSKTVSNTISEPNSVAMLSSLSSSKEKDSAENALRKLFRKESTSKLSFSRRIGRAKGPGSLTNSEKNLSAGRSSFGDLEDITDETGATRGVLAGAESVTSSPLLGPSKSRDKSESKLKGSGWFSMKKKNREKESLDIDRDRERTLDTESVSSVAPTEDGDKRVV